MKLFVGLGNPGKEYEYTRHNVGWLCLDYLLENSQNENKVKFLHQSKFEADICKVEDILFVKPQTFMNESGRAVRKIMDFYQISYENLVVFHDDLDIRLGEFKLHFGKGPKIHNGINSIVETIKTSEFNRVRIGVDSRTSETRNLMLGREYVLKALNREERDLFHSVFETIYTQITLLKFL